MSGSLAADLAWSRRARGELFLLVGLIVGILACFVDKAFTIDDPLNLWLAEQIGNHPLDPFGFSANWNASQLPMNEINQNPPVTGYFIAAAAALLGWSEVALHFAFLIPAAVATTATYLLARRFCSRPLEASLAGLLTPVFLVSSTNIMCESILLAAWCTSIWCWVTGFDRGGVVWLLAGASVAALAFVTKFSGIALVPLLFAYGLLRSRKLGVWCLFLLVPLAAVFAYDRVTASLYGVGHFTGTLRFARAFGVADQGVDLGRIVVGLVFTGGCLAPVLFYAPLLWSRRACLAGVALVGLGLLSWPAVGAAVGVSFPGDPAAARWGLPLQFVVFAVAGASLVALGLDDARRRRDAESALLVLWLLGSFVFAALLNWVTNGRSILPMAPALGILLVRRLEDRERNGSGSGVMASGLALAASALLGLWVTSADYRWANDVRRSAGEIAAVHVGVGHATYFLGNWGLQHYLGQAGATAVDAARWPSWGDRLIVSNNNSDVRSPPAELAIRLEERYGREPRGMRTLSRGVAGFYASAIGPLPYAWTAGPGDRYTVWELLHPVRFSPSW